MACASCGKSRPYTSNSTRGRQSVLSVSDSNFVRKVYIGPTEIVTSSSPYIHYGQRKAGDIMWVLKADVEQHSDLWTDIETYKPKATKKRTRKVVKDKSDNDT